MLAAAESLLSEQLFEEVGMADIARRAGVAVGTLYQRFPSKEALVPALFERHNAVVGRRIMSLFSHLASESSLRRRIDLVVGFAVDYHVRHRGLLRTLTTYVRANPSVASDALFAEREAVYSDVARRMLDGEPGTVPADRLDAALFALGLINSVCREQILFGDVSPLSRRRGQSTDLKRKLGDVVECALARRTSSQPSRRS